MGSVTQWVSELRTGDEQAAEALWNRYYERLVGYACKRLEGQRNPANDGHSVAAKAFSEFWLAAKQGRYPDLTGRDGLWRLLLRITACRAADLKRENWRRSKLIQGESALPGWNTDAGLKVLGEVLGDTPSPEVVAASTEECGRLLSCLGDPSLREIALDKLEGYKNEEIARRMGCGVSTVERKLRLVRRIWNQEME